LDSESKRALLRCETAARHHAIQAYTTSFGVLDSFVSTTRNTWTAPSGNLARSPRLNPSSSRTSPQFRGWLPAPRFNEITFFMSNRTIVIGLIPPADTCTAPSPSIVTMACFLEIFCTAKTKAVVHSSRTAKASCGVSELFSNCPQLSAQGAHLIRYTGLLITAPQH
jgi:hypothetical protein